MQRIYTPLSKNINLRKNFVLADVKKQNMGCISHKLRPSKKITQLGILQSQFWLHYQFREQFHNRINAFGRNNWCKD